MHQLNPIPDGGRSTPSLRKNVNFYFHFKNDFWGPKGNDPLGQFLAKKIIGGFIGPKKRLFSTPE